MALTEEECTELWRTSRETGKHIAVGFNRRYAPFYLEQKKFAIKRTGPAVVNCRMNSPGISGKFWAADPAIGGGIVGEAVHFIDLMYWLLESEPITVSAFSLPTGHDEPIGENNIVASFRFADGSIGNLTYCTIGSKSSSGEYVEIFTESGSIAVDNFKRLIIKTGLGKTKYSLWPKKGFAAQMISVLDKFRVDESPEVTVRDGARATIGALRMLESAQLLCPCEFDLDKVLQ
jgi:predicted dehydrogenase